MTLTIHIDSLATDSQIEAIRKLVDETVSRDVNWNGADHPVIETGCDFTDIEGAEDRTAATKLLIRIENILLGRTDDE